MFPQGLSHLVNLLLSKEEQKSRTWRVALVIAFLGIGARIVQILGLIPTASKVLEAIFAGALGLAGLLFLALALKSMGRPASRGILAQFWHMTVRIVLFGFLPLLVLTLLLVAIAVMTGTFKL